MAYKALRPMTIYGKQFKPGDTIPADSLPSASRLASMVRVKFLADDGKGAAKAAPAPSPAAPAAGGANLSQMKKAELAAMADDKGIDVAGMTKNDIITAIEEA